MDLLSVVAHELGHALGLPHSHHDDHDVMAEALPVGVRRMPEAHDADAALDHAHVPSPVPSGPASAAAAVSLPGSAVAAILEELALRSTAASAPPEQGATALADPLADRLVLEPFAAAQPGSEAGRVQKVVSPRPDVADRVLGEVAGYSLDGALLDELARALQQRIGAVLADRALRGFRTEFWKW